jgi:hypothetical protein
MMRPSENPQKSSLVKDVYISANLVLSEYVHQHRRDAPHSMGGIKTFAPKVRRT